MSDDDVRKLKETLDAAGEIWDKLKSQNLHKVAQGNDEESDVDEYVWALNDPYDDPYSRMPQRPVFTDIELPEPVAGSCKTCGCPPDKMPMVFRGTGWCCELHRKEQQENDDVQPGTATA